MISTYVMCVTAHVWGQRTTVELVLSSQFYVRSKDGTQVVRLEQQVLLPTEPSHQPCLCF